MSKNNFGEAGSTKLSYPHIAQQTENTTEPNHIIFVHILRGIAPLLVLWAHLGGWWLSAASITSGLQESWIDYVGRPLRLYQDGGHLGVLIFFLISGFVITHVSVREKPLEFVIRRFFRITPTLAISIAILPLLVVASQYWNLPTPLGIESSNYISGFFLVNYFTGKPQVLSLLWTLFIEIAFYFLTFLSLLSQKPNQIRSTWLMLASIFAYSALSVTFPVLHPLMWELMYIPFLLIGRSFYLAWKFPSQRTQAAFLGIACYASFLLIYSQVSPGQLLLTGCEPIISHFYALLLFFTLATAKINRCPPILSFFADISYPLYLIHAPLGGTILFFLHKHQISYIAALPVAFSAVTFCSYLINKFVEVPAVTLGKACYTIVAQTLRRSPRNN